ncbi:hypothetical protein Dsin_031882 [Dipteronia sinensis]|uniref:PGG domain-containing protein n=1 Tax=Dipteronia sinensis TaxID=43782 RepID=A0AAD9ZLV8_9ROSI|nr:hypothetical protein Dsin_031882 [Dipteronia sinensis]
MSHIKIKPPVQKQDLNSTINYLFVVAALVVGAAFAGAIQIPYESGNGSSSTNDVGIAPAANSGSSAEKKKDLLSDYLLGNIITMNLSNTAAFSLFLALLIDTNLASILVSVSFLLLELALLTMAATFANAMLLRLKIFGDDQGYRSLVKTIVIFQDIQNSLVIISLLVFTLGRETFALIIYFILFCFYFPLYRLWRISSLDLVVNRVELLY